MASKKMALIATKGTLDMAYPPFILASTAAALGWEVQIFFTFYGLSLLRHDLGDVKISPLANPAMPMPVPMPVLVQILPGERCESTQYGLNQIDDMDLGSHFLRSKLLGKFQKPPIFYGQLVQQARIQIRRSRVSLE